MSPLTTYVVETLVTLLAIVVIALLVVYAARRMGMGRPAGPLELVGRLPLDGRRVIYLVRMDKKVFVLAASEAGLNKLGELDATELTLDEGQAAPMAFRQVFERALGKSTNKHGDKPRRDEDAA